MSEALYPPESASDWTPRPVPHPLGGFMNIISQYEAMLLEWKLRLEPPTSDQWATAVWTCLRHDRPARDPRPISAHLKQPGWKWGRR